MQNNYWKENKKIFVNSKLPNCPADNYYKPQIEKINVEISSDEDDFVPAYIDSNSASIYANIPNKLLKISKSDYVLIDCGFSIKTPIGYKVSFSLDSVFSNKGLILTSTPDQTHNEQFRINLGVLNLGDAVTVEHKQKIGLIWIDPVYYFEWTEI
jgi:hypothetical protein